MRITVRLLAENKVEKSSKVFVKTDKLGFPVIIPKTIRDTILSKEVYPHIRKKMIGSLLTILSIFRVFRTNVKPDLSSIIEPFNGLSRSLDSSLMIESLKELKLYQSYRSNSRCSLYWSEASGPNTVIAGFGSINDALALLHTPKQLRLALYSLLMRLNIGLFLYLIVSITLFGPIYLLLTYCGLIKPFVNGRLSVVYDQAGKARVIAITSYWLQTLFKPLHQFLFNKLEMIEEDGTFDQDKPFKELLKRLSNLKSTLYGFDLSAATDRLPIELQEDILKLIGFNLPWKDLLNISWVPNFRTDSDISSVSYAVGQPMGALSSWAMLAISHHVIVKCAAIMCGLTNFKDYCVLGDDIVIANDEVAIEYLNLMTYLGLSINRQKSVESKIFTEFAKKLRGYNDLDYTPIGPGLILQTIRSTSYSIKFTIELFLVGLINLDSLKEKFSTAPKFFRKRLIMTLWATTFGAYISSISKGRTLDVAFATMESRPLVRYMISNINRFFTPLYAECYRESYRHWNNFRLELIIFFKWIWFINLTRRGYNSVPSVFNIFNIGFWVLVIKYIKAYLDLIQFDCKLYVMRTKEVRIEKQELYPLTKMLDMMSIVSINWGDQNKIRDSSRTLSRIVKEVDRGSLVRTLLRPSKWN